MKRIIITTVTARSGTPSVQKAINKKNPFLFGSFNKKYYLCPTNRDFIP